MGKHSIFKISIEDEMVADDAFDSEYSIAFDPNISKIRGTDEYGVTEAIEYSNNTDSLTADIQELDNCIKLIEESEEITSDAEDAVEVQEDRIEENPADITENDVNIAQEQYAYYLGLLRLDYSKVRSTRHSMESASTPLEKYRISTEALKEMVSAVIGAIATVVAKVVDMVKKMRTKVMVWFGDFSKQATSLLEKVKDTKPESMITKENMSKLDQGERDKLKNSMGLYCAIFKGEKTVAKEVLSFSFSISTLGFIKTIYESNKVWQDILTGQEKNAKAAYQKGIWERIKVTLGLADKKYDDISSGNIANSYVVGSSESEHSKPVKEAGMERLEANVLQKISKNAENYAEIYYIVGVNEDSVQNMVLEFKKGKSDIGIPTIMIRPSKFDLKSDIKDKCDESSVVAFSGQNKENLVTLLTGVADKSKGIENYYKQLTALADDTLKLMNDNKKLVMGKEADSGFWEKVGVKQQFNAYLRSVRAASTSGIIMCLKEYINISKRAITFGNIVIKEKGEDDKSKSMKTEEEKKADQKKEKKKKNK